MFWALDGVSILPRLRTWKSSATRISAPSMPYWRTLPPVNCLSPSVRRFARDGVAGWLPPGSMPPSSVGFAFVVVIVVVS